MAFHFWCYNVVIHSFTFAPWVGWFVRSSSVASININKIIQCGETINWSTEVSNMFVPVMMFTTWQLFCACISTLFVEGIRKSKVGNLKSFVRCIKGRCVMDGVCKCENYDLPEIYRTGCQWDFILRMGWVPRRKTIMNRFTNQPVNRLGPYFLTYGF